MVDIGVSIVMEESYVRDPLVISAIKSHLLLIRWPSIGLSKMIRYLVRYANDQTRRSGLIAEIVVTRSKQPYLVYKKTNIVPSVPINVCVRMPTVNCALISRVRPMSA